jgi:hypothetical protein
MKNLVVSTALNYGVEQIKNFILSFRKYNQEDDIILIYKSEDLSRIESFLKQHNVQTTDFPYANAPIHVVASRFFRYHDIVAHLTDYKHILLADIRDVVFQANPFENLPDEDYIYAFMEDAGVKINVEPHHIGMIDRMYGAGSIGVFTDKNIICSGTILGTVNVLTEWLKVFNNRLIELQKVNPSVCYEMLLDQVIANYVFYFDEIGKKATLKSNGDIVATIGHCITHPNHVDKLELKDGIFYLNDKVPAIVHQYDRSPDYFRQISELYNVD